MATKVKFDDSDLNEIDNKEQIEQKKTTNSKKSSTTSKTKKPVAEKPSLTPQEVMMQQRENNEDKVLKAGNAVIDNMKIAANELLPNLKIDLNNLVITDSLNELEKFQNTELVFNSKPTFEVPLAQSCYAVFMDALKYADIDAIQSSNLDEFHTTLQMYQIVHKHIQATSMGRLSFDQFVSATSFFDLQSLFYGLHMQTFPGKTKFNFKCGFCKEKFDLDIPNDVLVFSKDNEVFDRFDKIRQSSRDIKHIMENSLINQSMRICLEQSKTIIDIKIPTLKDHLDLLQYIPAPKDENNEADPRYTLLFVKNLYMLNVPETLKKNSPIYYQVTDNIDILETIKQLGVADAKQLGREIDEWTGKFKIEYKIPDIVCPHCGKKIGALPIDMENTLFRLMLGQ